MALALHQHSQAPYGRSSSCSSQSGLGGDRRASTPTAGNAREDFQRVSIHGVPGTGDHLMGTPTELDRQVLHFPGNGSPPAGSVRSECGL